MAKVAIFKPLFAFHTTMLRVVLQSGYLFKKIHSSPVLTVEAYFDFKVLLPNIDQS